MRSIKERLEQSAMTIDTLERKRIDMRTPCFGLDTEWGLIERELHELELEILDHPGPLDRFIERPKRAAQ